MLLIFLLQHVLIIRFQIRCLKAKKVSVIVSIWFYFSNLSMRLDSCTSAVLEKKWSRTFSVLDWATKQSVLNRIPKVIRVFIFSNLVIYNLFIQVVNWLLSSFKISTNHRCVWNYMLCNLFLCMMQKCHFVFVFLSYCKPVFC